MHPLARHSCKESTLGAHRECIPTLNIISWLPAGGGEAFMGIDKSYPWPNNLFYFPTGDPGKFQNTAQGVTVFLVQFQKPRHREEKVTQQIKGGGVHQTPGIRDLPGQ